MATITTLDNDLGSPKAHPPINNQAASYVIYEDIDLAAAATAKGSALAASDIIEALRIPVGTVVITAGIKTITAQTGSTVLTFDLGVTGVDTDVWVDGFDAFAAVAGDFSQNPAAYQTITVGAVSDTIDLLIATLTTTNTGGVFRVWAVVVPIDLGPIKGTLAARTNQ